MSYYACSSQHIRQLLDVKRCDGAAVQGGKSCAPRRDLSTSPSLGKADGSRDKASSKSKKAKWRKWADQKLEPKKAAASASDIAAVTAAVPDPSQLSISEIPRPQLAGAKGSALSEAARKMTAKATGKAPKKASADAAKEDIIGARQSGGSDQELTPQTVRPPAEAFDAAALDSSKETEEALNRGSLTADSSKQPMQPEPSSEAIDATPAQPYKPSLLERLAKRGKDLASRAGWGAGASTNEAGQTSTKEAVSGVAQWDAFVADQKAGETSPLQPAAPTAGGTKGEDGPQGGRKFRAEHLTSGASVANIDPRYGFANIGRSAVDMAANVESVNPALDGAGRPVAMAPSRLHPTRDFFPGQFYRPADLNPFVEAETNKFQPASRNLKVVIPTLSDVQLYSSFRNTAFLSHFLTSTGRIIPRKQSGLQAKVHRRVARHIKLAKAMALAPIDKPSPKEPRRISLPAANLVPEAALRGMAGQGLQ